MPPLAAAGVDVGTNSTLLTIARPSRDGALTILDERCVITRLGEGLGETGQLTEAAMARSVEVLAEFGAAIKALGAEARAAGTSALRRAENGEHFLARAANALGVQLEVLSGVDQVRLGYRGALCDLSAIDEKAGPIVLDPGGGSTEVVSNDGLALSFEVGAVRLTEAFLRTDPPLASERKALAEHVRQVISELAPRCGRPLVFVGGTATTLAALDLGLSRYDGARVHGHQISLSTVQKLSQRLASLPIREREKIPCLPPGRADVAVAGAQLIEELLLQLECRELTVSDRGLRYGLIAEIIESWH